MKTCYVDNKMGRPWVATVCLCFPGGCWGSSGVFQLHFFQDLCIYQLVAWESMTWTRQTESWKLSPSLFRERGSHKSSTVTGSDLCKLFPVEIVPWTSIMIIFGTLIQFVVKPLVLFTSVMINYIRFNRKDEGVHFLRNTSTGFEGKSDGRGSLESNLNLRTVYMTLLSMQQPQDITHALKLWFYFLWLHPEPTLGLLPQSSSVPACNDSVSANLQGQGWLPYCQQSWRVLSASTFWGWGGEKYKEN